jgi:peptidoglycan/xylan/chitin deacetylase (PgdA/CDA1 family)
VTEYSRARWREVVRNRQRQGRDDVERYRQEPSVLPRLTLGGADTDERGWLTLRAFALALHVPPRALAGLGTVLPVRRLSSACMRFTASYAYWAGVRGAADPETWRRLRRGVPILMYHAIGAPGERPSRYVVPVKSFARQMRWLKRRGYHVTGLDDYARYRSEHRLPPAKTIVVTFDDGYLDNLTLARPILEQLGLPATIFLVSAVEDRNAWSTGGSLAQRPMMKLEDARQAVGGLLTFGAHTRTHPALPDISPAEAEREVTGSKHDLERALGVPVTTFAYPHGRVDDEVRAIVERAGFTCACGVVPGRNRPAADDFLLRRVEIFGTDGLVRFALTVLLGDVGRRRRHDE